MVAVRVGRVALALQPGSSKVRVGRVAVTGTAPTTPKVRVGRAALTGNAPIALNPFGAVAPVEPETTVTVTATLAAGSADSYTWRRISGPIVTFTGTGNTRSFTAPSIMPPGDTLVIGVTATSGTTTSPEQAVSISILPQTRWYFAGSWVGQRPTVTL